MFWRVEGGTERSEPRGLLREVENQSFEQARRSCERCWVFEDCANVFWWYTSGCLEECATLITNLVEETPGSCCLRLATRTGQLLSLGSRTDRHDLDRTFLDEYDYSETISERAHGLSFDGTISFGLHDYTLLGVWTHKLTPPCRATAALLA